MKARWLKYLPEVLLAAAIFFAFAHAVSTTHDLEYGFNPDLYRDTGAAQSILNGDFPSDPIYLGERAWYNPLVPTLIAALSRLTQIPPHILYVRAGAYLNLLAPLGFYVLVARLFNRWTALAAAVGYLFLVENRAIGYFASYTPWLFPTDFGQGVFYLALATYWQALTTERLRWYLGFGSLWGIAFLTHTSPALILGILFAITTLTRLYAVWDEDLRSPVLYRRLALALAAVIPTVMISLPLLATILGYYQLQTVNTAPATFRSSQMEVNNITQLIGSQLSVWTAVATLGLLHLVKMRSNHITRQLVLLWLVSAVGLLLYDYGVQLLLRLGVSLPVIIPSWHLVVYLEAVKAVLFGFGLIILLRLGAGMIGTITPRIMAVREYPHPALVTLVLVVLVLVAYPTYRTRYVFTDARDQALEVTQIMHDRAGAFQWVMQNTTPSDVFIASDYHLSMFVVAQAGRKLVAAPPTFSNPYVDLHTRENDQKAMLEALINGNTRRFERIATEYDLGYIVASGETRDALAAAQPTELQETYSVGDVAIYHWVRPE